MMTRKTSFLTVLIALLVLVVGWSMAQNVNVRFADNPRDAADISSPGKQGDDDDNNTLTVLLIPDNGSFDIVPSANGGPFYIGGTLFDVGTGEELGAFQCWGWFFTAERRMVTQEYNIGDAGTIIAAGEELLNPLAILGGTGDFTGAGGEVLFEFPDEGILVHFIFGGSDDEDEDDE